MEDEDMKKQIIVLLTVALMVMMTSCGSGTTSSDENSGGKFDQYKAGKYVEIMESGTYYLECTAYVTGIEETSNVETSMKMAVDGKNSSVEIIVPGFDFPVRILTVDGKLYYINDDEKSYAIMDGETTIDPEDTGIFDYEGIKYGSDGKGAISALAGVDTNQYDYEEFTVGTGEDKTVARYYFKGDNLYAIEVTAGEVSSAMVINELTQTVPDGLIEMPSGYKSVELASFFQ
jgi:hypothetical protein